MIASWCCKVPALSLSPKNKTIWGQSFVSEIRRTQVHAKCHDLNIAICSSILLPSYHQSLLSLCSPVTWCFMNVEKRRWVSSLLLLLLSRNFDLNTTNIISNLIQIIPCSTPIWALELDILRFVHTFTLLFKESPGKGVGGQLSVKMGREWVDNSVRMGREWVDNSVLGRNTR